MTHTLPTPASRRTRRRLMSGGAVGLAMSALMLAPQARAQVTPPVGTAFQGTPQVVSGGASIVQTPTVDTISVTTPQAVINWTPADRTGTGTIDFLPGGLRAQFVGNADFTVLNRIIPVNGADVPVARMVALNGQISSGIVPPGLPASFAQPGGNVWFYSPGGILVGNSAVINVGSLLLTTRDIDTTGGLFGPTGEIRFRNSALGTLAASAASVDIAAGAQINAGSAVNGAAYIAVVAPRIVQAGTVRADGSIALVAAEQADIRINQGLFDITVLVGSDNSNGIVHTGTTGGPSDTSATYESRAYLVAVPKNQAMTMLLSGTIGFETAMSVSTDANGGIVLSAGHNIVGGVVGPQVGAPFFRDASMTITDSRFANDLQAVASRRIIARPTQSCQPLCSASNPTGQLLFGGNASFFGQFGATVSIGQAQRIIAAGDLTIATGGLSGAIDPASLAIDNALPPSTSTAGGGIVQIGGNLLISASDIGDLNVNSTDGSAFGGIASLAVNNGVLQAATITVESDARAILRANGTGAFGTAGTARITIENGSAVQTGGMRVSANGYGSGTGFDVQQNPTLAANGGAGSGGNALLTVHNSVLSLGQGLATLTANGYGAAGSVTSGDGTGGVAMLTIDHDGGATGYISRQTELQARGFGGGSGFDPALGIFLSTADGGDATGGRVLLTITDTLANSVTPGVLLLDAGADGGAAVTSGTATSVVGGNATSGAASLSMSGPVSNLDVDTLTLTSNATGGIGLGQNGVGTGGAGVALSSQGTTQIALSTGANLRVTNGTSVRADGIGGVGLNQSGRGQGGGSGISVNSGASFTGSDVILSATGIGGGAFTPNQSFAPSTLIGGDANGNVASLIVQGSFTASSLTIEANAFGGDSNPASAGAAGASGGDAFGGGTSITHFGGTLTVPVVTMRSNATAGSSGNSAGGTGRSLGGNAAYFVSNGATTLIDDSLTIEAFSFTRIGGGGAVGLVRGGIAELVARSNGRLNGNPDIVIDASALHTNATGPIRSSLLTRGGTVRVNASGGTINADHLTVRASADGNGTDTATTGATQGGTLTVNAELNGTLNVAQALLAEASGRGGSGVRGSAGIGGTAALTVQGGQMTLVGPAEVAADGISGASTGGFNSPDANGGTVNLSTVAFGTSGQLTFGTLTVHADGLHNPFAPNGDPLSSARGNARGGTVNVDIFSGSIDGTNLTLSAVGSGVNSGIGNGGVINLRQQTGGDVDISNVALFADGFGGNTPADSDNSDAPLVGGTGRGGNVSIELTSGSFTTVFFSASANGIGGNGFSPVVGSSSIMEPLGGKPPVISAGPSDDALFAGDGGTGNGGTINAIIGGDDRFVFGEPVGASTANLGFANFTASGTGGNGGDYIVQDSGDIYTPGRGGNGNGGIVLVNLPGGTVSGSIFASAGGRGGNGGRIFGFDAAQGSSFAGLPGDPQPVGGDATGGFAEIRVAAATSASLAADATASAGEGGMALSGANGGVANGGVARIVVDDGVDAGSINVALSAAGFGGRGGRALHGDGGDGGSGIGGAAFFDIANGGTADVLNTAVDARGVGGEGRQGTIDPGLAAIPGSHNGGDGGDGTGGTIAIRVIDADLALSAGNGEGILLESFGFGGFGGDGASGGSAPTAGGNGGDGIGGTINLSAAGGTLAATDGTAIQITVGGEGGESGIGVGVGGEQGLTGLRHGGIARLEAHDSATGAGLVDLGTLVIDASGNFGGRVELIDDSAGPGIAIGSFAVSTAGTAFASSDFSLTGSGVYVSSRNGAIGVDGGLFLDLGNGAFQIDAADSGGLDIAGDFGLSAQTLIANHNGRGSNPTIAAASIDFTANAIMLQPGTLVTARSGNLQLDAATRLQFGALSAPFGSIFLFSGGDIVGDDAVAGGSIEAQSDDDIDIGNLTALGIVSGQTSSAPTGGIVRLRADDRIDFGSISASDGVELDAGTNIAGDDISSGGFIFATSAEGNIVIDTSTASGDIAFLAAEGDVRGDFAESEFSSITIRAVDVGFGELYANSVIDIRADDDVDLVFAQTGGEGCGTFGCGEGGGFDQAKLLKLAPTGSDILIEAGDTVTLGTLDAADSIVIQAGTLAGATSSLTAGKQLTATIGGNAVFGSLLSGGNMALTAGGTATGQSAETGGSGTSLALSATNGLAMGTIRAGGTANLAASAGAITVGNLRAVGLVDASGRSVTVSEGTGLLDFQTLRATAGDARVTVGSGDLVVRSGMASGTLTLTTQNGAIETRGVQGGTVTIDSSRGVTLNNAATATGALGITARNTATINGVASGGTVRITSGDIVIAGSARVGTGGTTTDLLLINGDGSRRTFVGGAGSTAGYSLSTDEMTRLFGGNITIRAPRVAINGSLVASAPGTSIIAPSGEPDLVIDAFSINGGGSATGNLGSAGILRIETPGFARVVGAAQVTNATPNNSFVVAADRSLQVILGSGSLRINGGSGLVGALRLISEDIVVATASAITDIAATTDMAAIDDRLASNDGVLSDEGALSGGTIRFEIGRGLYVQNSGNGEGFDDRRGFTAGTGGVSIFTGEGTSTAGGGTARLVINGRTTSEAGEILTGIDAFSRISVNQTLLTGDSQTVNGIDAGSTINGCLIVSASNCFQFEIDLIPPIQDNPLVNFDDEESGLTDGSDPLNLTDIVELRDADRMSNEPIVDEPVTGSGNDDLWSPTGDEEEDD